MFTTAKNILGVSRQACPRGNAKRRYPQISPQPDSIDEERPINWRSIVPDICRDQKNIWTFPAKLVRGEEWKPTLAFAAILGGLIVADPHASPYFRNNSNFSEFNRRLSGTNTAIATALVPASFYALGLVRKDSYATQTAMLAGESAVDGEILGWVLQNATGRLRPSAHPARRELLRYLV